MLEELPVSSALLWQASMTLGPWLLCVRSPTGIPFGTLGLRSRKAYNPPAHRGASTASEVGTLALELAVLSRHTQTPTYLQCADRITRHLESLAPEHGLYPMYINPVRSWRSLTC